PDEVGIVAGKPSGAAAGSWLADAQAQAVGRQLAWRPTSLRRIDGREVLEGVIRAAVAFDGHPVPGPQAPRAIRYVRPSPTVRVSTWKRHLRQHEQGVGAGGARTIAVLSEGVLLSFHIEFGHRNRAGRRHEAAAARHTLIRRRAIERFAEDCDLRTLGSQRD